MVYLHTFCILGFNLWTSAHGFHHYTLSHKKGWRCIWAAILFTLVSTLVGCIVYYFYYVFSTAIYSRIIIESPSQRQWPTTIVCMILYSPATPLPTSFSKVILASWSREVLYGKNFKTIFQRYKP